jgi:hypothetical protein
MEGIRSQSCIYVIVLALLYRRHRTGSKFKTEKSVLKKKKKKMMMRRKQLNTDGVREASR